MKYSQDSARFIGSEIYRNSTYGIDHPLSIPRVSSVIDLCRALDWLPAGSYTNSPRAKPLALEMWHDPAYISALVQAERDGVVDGLVRQTYGLGTRSNPVFDAMYRRPATSVGGSLLAAQFLRNGGVVFNPGGGTHHGMPARASGFCYLNDLCIAICAFLEQGLERIAYVDIDAHHGDGVEYGFGMHPAVMMISIHEENRWPFSGALEKRGAGQVWNIPVPKGFNDSEMTKVMEELALPLLSDYRPEVIILQCGADALTDDPLSRLQLSNNCHWDIVRQLHQIAPRLLVTGGGGYNPWTVARLWAGVWATLAEVEIPAALPAPASAVLSRLKWMRKPGYQPKSVWLDSLRDTPNPGPVSDGVNDRLALLRNRARRWI